MRKAILMSLVVATLWIPMAAAASTPDLRKGMRLVQKRYVIFCAAYVFAVLYILPRL